MSTVFGKCPHCPPAARSVRLWGDGVCLHHYRHPEAVKDKREKVVKPTLQQVQAIAAAPLQPTKKQLDTWFGQRMRERPRVCTEPGCVVVLPGLGCGTTWLIKATVAHVVPKRNFWSVALHPLNRVFLCKGHHDRYDSSWDAAQQMGVWPQAVENFQQFMHLIHDKELRHLPPALRELTKR